MGAVGVSGLPGEDDEALAPGGDRGGVPASPRRREAEAARRVCNPLTSGRRGRSSSRSRSWLQTPPSTTRRLLQRGGDRVGERPEAQAGTDRARHVDLRPGRPTPGRRARAAGLEPEPERRRCCVGHHRDQSSTRAAAAAASTTSTIEMGGTGPVALNTPCSGSARHGRAKRRDRVRRSPGCASRCSPARGASPPWAARWSHYVNRPVWSCGPTTKPGLTTSAAVPERVGHDSLAERLERTVRAFRDLLGLAVERGQRPVLVVRDGEIRVDGDARDEHVGAHGALQQLHGLPTTRGSSPRRR